MSRPIITFTTDFGIGSSYIAEMKGVVLSLNAEVQLVDVTHSIAPQDIRQGALIFDSVARRFPPETIHVGVIDPGVGTERDILCVRMQNQYFIGPDNGLLSSVADRNTPEQIIALRNREYWLSEVSSTFHGRDIMAPAAAYLSLGLSPELLGEPLDDLIKLEWQKVHVASKRVKGSVVSFDSFGNAITDISRSLLLENKTPPDAVVKCGDVKLKGIFTTYKNKPNNTLVALFGSQSMLEIALVGGSAIDQLKVEVGATVEVLW